ncbi:4'-phosphopantetheinyl transferase family protein [Namhaeicola litoreus]|uniref:4'-phosphopantetheinyl transferase superfamily protein n=1 Tax=Namhaeicola litoreus TaxID=1052145 RepID=A0ABW3Y301_9FLAO
MIGSDIVDLTELTQYTKDRRKRFLEKVFSLKEQYLIDSSDNPEQMIWRLWSMKESAYKIVSRSDNERILAPTKLKCDIFNHAVGAVCTDRYSFITTTKVAENCVYSIASNSSKNPIAEFLLPFKSNEQSIQSKVIYKKFIDLIGDIYQIPTHLISMKKNNIGAPILLYKNNPMQVDFSLSHHGKYGFIAIQA